MILRAAASLLWFAAWGAAQTSGCVAIENDRILAADLARALPAFAGLPAETMLAYAPAPGAKRIFHSPELLALARRYSISVEAPGDVCFEWPVAPLDRTRVLEAMRASLQIPDARIEISEMSLYPAPRGQIEFPRERLGTPALPGQPAPVLWRGDVVFAGTRRFAVWARVKITAPYNRIVATENLKAGQPIAATQLRMDAAEGFPVAAKAVSTIESLTGMLPLRPIAAGAEVRKDLVAGPNDVNRGDQVTVEVLSGSARLGLTGLAESGGKSGDLITIRNPNGNKAFQARVSGKGKAVVQAGGVKVN